MENDLFIINKASQYAKTFTENYIKYGPENWQKDALEWFSKFNVNQQEKDAFIKKCENFYENVYIEVFGKEDNYYDLVQCIKQIEKIHGCIQNIQNRKTLPNSNIKFNEVYKKLIEIQLSLDHIRLSINHNYKFETNGKDIEK